MGLLLSVLVVCVGVLEVIACVRHFQDGYLPLWTPHCAVTSGYTNTYERWRSKPSDSFEFRSSDDTSGSLNYTQDQSSENYPQASSSFQNGFTPQRQDHEIEENRVSSTDHFHERLHEDEIIPSSSVNLIEKEFDLQHISDTKTSLQSDGSEVKEIPKDVVKSVTFDDRISHIPNETYDIFSDIEIRPSILYDVKDKFVPEVETDTKLPQEVGISQFASDVSDKNEEFVSISDLNTEIITKPSDNHEIECHHEIISSTKDLDIESKVPILHSEVGLQEASPGVISVYNLEAESSENFVKDQVTAQEYNVENTEAKISVLSADLENVRLSEEKFGETKLNEKPACLIETLHDQSIIAEESESDRLKEEFVSLVEISHDQSIIAEESKSDRLEEEPISLVETLHDQFTIAEKSESDRLNEEPISLVKTSHDQSIIAEESESDRLKEEPVSLVETVHDQSIIAEESESDRLKEEPVSLVETVHDQSIIAEESESDRLKEEPINLVEILHDQSVITEESESDRLKEEPINLAETLHDQSVITEESESDRLKEESVSLVDTLHDQSIIAEESESDRLKEEPINLVETLHDQSTIAEESESERLKEEPVSLVETLENRIVVTEELVCDNQKEPSVNETFVPTPDITAEQLLQDNYICELSEDVNRQEEVINKQGSDTVSYIENEEIFPTSDIKTEESFQPSTSEFSVEDVLSDVTSNDVPVPSDQITSGIQDGQDIKESVDLEVQSDPSIKLSDTLDSQYSVYPNDDSETHIEDYGLDAEEQQSSVSATETSATPGVIEKDVSSEEISKTPEISGSVTVAEQPTAEVCQKIQDDEALPVQVVPEVDQNLLDEEIGAQHISEASIEPRTPSTNFESEKEFISEGADEDISESRLGFQTTTTDSVNINDNIIDQTITKSDEATDTIQQPLETDEADVHTSASPVAPLSIDTSSVSPLEHQSSLSPPKLPSTPKKSKADISWPTFFPGAPVIKRPSVSFATPEAVFTNEDEELLRKYAEEASSAPPCIKKSDDISTTESETTSTSEEKSSETTSTSEKISALDEDQEPVIFREKSPSSIVAGNDFSRKELALQRRKSYKHKRYSSATEIATREEQAEDRSFSENKPGITRASSLKEPRKKFRKPAKASSFEDVLLRNTTAESKERQLTEDSSIPEGKETERADVLREEETTSEGVTGVSDESDRLGSSAERNEPKQSELRPKDIRTGEDAGEEDVGDEDCSLSEEQSSSQQTSAPKEAFWLIFSGEYTKAMSKDWHSGHFCCWQCDESLTGQRYVLRDDHPYCIKCYESVFANVCEECNKTIGIDSKDLSYKDKHWHEACFLCNKCRVSLVDKQFGSKADKIYCGNCYDAQFASRCDGCGEIFRAGTKKMEYKTRQWHEKCFCCCVCKTAIGTKSFIPREQEIYCATCYEEKFATRCVKCNKIITSGGVTYKNEPWHRECFTCTHCNTSLAGQRFTSRDEKPYCADCFGELFAKRCTACSKPITGIGGTRFISFEDRHWHNDCFICASCKTSLVGRGFITDADDIICPECAKQKLM